MHFFNSKVDEIELNNQKYFVKRDDLLDNDFGGNKARKFHYFLNQDLSKYKKIISHGSIQSNAMYSLSVLAKLKNLKFEYYVKNVPSYLMENPNGNYLEAIKNGMVLKFEDLKDDFLEDELFIAEGGAVREAKYGLEILAIEIKDWVKEKKIDKLKIFLPSGTGTTALYLQKYLPFEVLTCSCVGDDEYLEKQFNMLENTNHPKIFEKPKKYHFGKLYKEFYLKHLELLEKTGIEFDLLYDSLGWIVFENYINNFEQKEEYTFLYIHQGGVLGNKTMLDRYRYKFTII